MTPDNFNLSHLPFYVLSREGVGRYAMELVRTMQEHHRAPYTGIGNDDTTEEEIEEEANDEEA